MLQRFNLEIRRYPFCQLPAVPAKKCWGLLIGEALLRKRSYEDVDVDDQAVFDWRTSHYLAKNPYLAKFRDSEPPTNHSCGVIYCHFHEPFSE